MNIKYITIKNIRGLENHTIQLDMIPNKPSLLVAPNGSGKSSFAIAFQSLVKGKIKLNKENIYKRNKNLKPEIVIEANINGKNEIFCANDQINEISKIFGIAVINSRIKSEVVKQRINGQLISTGRMTVEPIILENKVSPKIRLSYNFEEIYGLKLKQGIVPSIGALLTKRQMFTLFPIDKLKSLKTTLKKINQVIEIIGSYSGSDLTVDEIKKNLENDILPILQSLPNLKQIVNVLSLINSDKSLLGIYLKAMQLLLLYDMDKAAFEQAIENAKYVERKQAYIKLFDSLKETWQNIKPKEQGGKLLVDIPYANRLSNGERDIIVFLAMLEKARLSLTKKNNILIIDEVFDYLDDANLVAAQYYISHFIKEMKKVGKNIFPIILTHLNPDFYRHYAFKDLRVYYLIPLPHPEKSNIMMALLRKREELESNGAEDLISKYMLHFHNDYTRDMSGILNQAQKDAHWGDINKFKEYCNKNVDNYFNNKVFCPLAVCIMLREWIESYCYNQLQNDKKDNFLKEHGTQDKLLYAQNNGIDYPEIFNFLGLIYNDPLHATDRKDLRQTLYSRLQNNTIRAMIKKVKDICKLQ